MHLQGLTSSMQQPDFHPAPVLRAGEVNSVPATGLHWSFRLPSQ